MLKILIAGISLISFNLLAGENIDKARYSAYFKTISSSCILSVNGLDYISTLKGSRNISTGSDITESLENNKTNTIGIIFFPSKSKIKTERYTCEITTKQKR